MRLDKSGDVSRRTFKRVKRNFKKFKDFLKKMKNFSKKSLMFWLMRLDELDDAP